MAAQRSSCALRRVIGTTKFRVPTFNHAQWRSPTTVKLRSTEPSAEPKAEIQTEAGTSPATIEKELAKFTRQTASTFAPRASGAVKNPAFRGSTLYNVFEWQAWFSLLVGGFLSFNVLFPTDEPSIPRLLGMWSVWIFTIPSLRARECIPSEKDALNILFLAVPLLNVLLPFVWKNFGFIYTADLIAIVGTYYAKGVWRDVYGLPFGASAGQSPPAAMEDETS